MKVLAFDFGASSGRAILGEYKDGLVKLKEIHRFPNDPVLVQGNLYWDILRLFYHVKQSIIKCVQLGHQIEAIGIDTWGVDFGLLDEYGHLIGNPVHYRDKRTDGMLEAVTQLISKEDLYQKTGIQFMDFNTIYQLYTLKEKQPQLLSRTKTILFIPDLLIYFLTGEMNCEYTVASTSGLLNVKTKDWDKEVLDQLGIPSSLFPKIKLPGEKAGVLSKAIAEELGIGQIEVIFTASHDTASAVVSVPSKNPKNAFISSGTWSLLGKECDFPIVNKDSFKENYTNEGGYDGKFRFIKNISGLWILQEVKRYWEQKGEVTTFEALNSLVEKTNSQDCFIDPNHHSFLTPGNMVEKINDYFIDTNQKQLSSKGEVVCCILESLALMYRNKLEVLEKLTSENIEVLHLVGGGTKNKHLCQFTANATGKIVIAGPVEATTIGNIMVQFISKKQISDINEARRIIDTSFECIVYYPIDINKWNEKYCQFINIINNDRKLKPLKFSAGRGK